MLNKKFFLFQAISIQNFFILNYFLLVLFFFGYSEIASKGFVCISITNLFTYGLSANYRNIFLGNKRLLNIDIGISFRIKITMYFGVFSLFIIYLMFGSKDFFFLALLTISSFQSWILELIIAKNQSENFISKTYIFNSILLIIFYPLVILYSEFNNQIILISLNIILNIIIFSKYFFLKSNEYHFLENNKKALFSTFFRSFSNYVWRYSAFLLVGSTKSAILFVGFALGSFFVTLFDVSYGATFNKIKNKISIFLKIFITYLSGIIIVILLINYGANYSSTDLLILNYTTLFSVLGSFFMFFAFKKRQKLFLKKKNHNKNFAIDNISYTFNMLIIPIIFIINENLLIFAYLCSSLIFYLLYYYYEFITDKK